MAYSLWVCRQAASEVALDTDYGHGEHRIVSRRFDNAAQAFFGLL